MKEIKLKVIHQNWSLMGMGEWNNTEWNIYNDLSVEIKVKYNPIDIEEFDDTVTAEMKISIDKYNEIVKQLELSKKEEIFVDGCDGDAWEFIQYNDNSEIWKRELGYIYGIKSLEKVGKILEKLVEV